MHVYFVIALEIMDIKHLQTKEARRKWEQIFNDSYLKPILTTLDMSITRTMNSITSDDQQGIEPNKVLYTHHYNFTHRA